MLPSPQRKYITKRKRESSIAEQRSNYAAVKDALTDLCVEECGRGANHNTQDESTAFGTEHENTTATLTPTNQRLSLELH